VHAGLVAQPESLQSTSPSQSSSTPPVQTSGAPGWMFASASLQSPPAAHQPSPSASVQVQSRAQLPTVSSPLHAPSPQHTVRLCAMHWDPHRPASQPTGFWPAKPQQKRPWGLPPWRPAQSAGQETQLSPLPAWQTPSPQTAAVPTQSAGQESHVSPGSQTPFAQGA